MCLQIDIMIHLFVYMMRVYAVNSSLIFFLYHKIHLYGIVRKQVVTYNSTDIKERIASRWSSG